MTKFWSLPFQATGGPSIEFRAGRVDLADAAQCPPNGRLPEAEHGCGAAVDEHGRLGRNSAAKLLVWKFVLDSKLGNRACGLVSCKVLKHMFLILLMAVWQKHL